MKKRRKISTKKTIIRVSVFFAAIVVISILLFNIDGIIGYFDKLPKRREG